MSPMKKSLSALAATAMLAGFGYATAQSTDTMPADTGMPSQSQTTMPADQTAMPADASTTSTPSMGADQAAPQTTTTTTVDTQTQVVPPPPTGVTDLAKPKGTVTATDKQDNGPLGVYNNVMTTGVTDAATRPSIGDHATPPIPAQPTLVTVQTERTTTTTTTPAEPQAAPEPAPAPAPEAAAPQPEPMPAPRADRN